LKVLTSSFESYDKHEYAKSAVLYVLNHFKPNLHKKSFGKHYQKKTTIDLFPDEQPDLFKLISSEIDHIAKTVGLNADWFSTDEYMKLWKKNFTQFLGENIEIQESLDSFESNSDDVNAQFEMIIDSLSRLSLLLKTSYDEWHQKSMAEFLESDLPFELYNLYNLSYIEKISVIRSQVGDLMRLRNMLHLVRSNDKKIKSELAKFEQRNYATSQLLTSVSRSELTLKFYLRSKNAQSLDDLFKTIPLKLDVNSDKQFNVYFNSFRDNLSVFTNFVDRKYLYEDIALNSSNSESFVDFDEKLRTVILKHG
jgi:hypothetical protein